MYITNAHINLQIFHSYVICNVKVRIKGRGDSYLLLRTDGVNLTVELGDRASGAMGYKPIATPSGSIISIHNESHSCLLTFCGILNFSLSPGVQKEVTILNAY